MARALKQRGMSAVFWGEAVVTAVYILNRSPTKALEGRTPYEAWHGRKPAVSHLRVSGCLAFAKGLGHVSKLDDRSTPGVFIDYAKDSKAYRILDPKTACAHGARHCVQRRARMGVGQGGGRRLDSDSRRFHYRVRPLRGSWGNGQLFFAERAYPSPQASTDSDIHYAGSTTLSSCGARYSSDSTPSSHDFNCDELFADSTTAGDASYSGTDNHTPPPPGTSTSTPAHVEPNPVAFATPLSHDE
jgi:hypothetical protein